MLFQKGGKKAPSKVKGGSPRGKGKKTGGEGSATSFTNGPAAVETPDVDQIETGSVDI